MEKKANFEFKGFHYIDGMPFCSNTTKENIERIRCWPLHEDDVIVATYPKSGTFLVETIVAAILESEDLDSFERDGCKSNRAPIEFDKTFEAVSTGIRPCVIHTHLRYDMLPRDIETKNIKVVFVMRNPKDVAVSYYHHSLISRNFGLCEGTWDGFFEAFISGEVPWGSWFEFNKGWLKYLNHQNVLPIKYEDYLRDPEKIIRGLAGFLGKELSDAAASRIASITSFDSMKNNPNLNVTYASFDQSKGRFLRKGQVGDWQNYFSKEQNSRLDKLYDQFVQETGLDLKFV